MNAARYMATATAVILGAILALVGCDAVTRVEEAASDVTKALNNSLLRSPEVTKTHDEPQPQPRLPDNDPDPVVAASAGSAPLQQPQPHQGTPAVPGNGADEAVDLTGGDARPTPTPASRESLTPATGGLRWSKNADRVWKLGKENVVKLDAPPNQMDFDFSPKGDRVAFIVANKDETQAVVTDGNVGPAFDEVRGVAPEKRGPPSLFGPDGELLYLGRRGLKGWTLVRGADQIPVDADTVNRFTSTLVAKSNCVLIGLQSDIRGSTWLWVKGNTAEVLTDFSPEQADGRMQTRVAFGGKAAFFGFGKTEGFTTIVIQEGGRQREAYRISVEPDDLPPGFRGRADAYFPLFAQRWLSEDGKSWAAVATVAGKDVLIVNGRKWPLPEPVTIGFSPDFTRWYFTRDKYRGEVVLNGVRLNGRVEGSPTFSPDGKHFAYVTTDSGKSLVVLNGQEGPVAWRIITRPVFSGDSQHIAYAKRRELRDLSKEPAYAVVVDGLSSGYFYQAPEAVHFCPDGLNVLVESPALFAVNGNAERRTHFDEVSGHRWLDKDRFTYLGYSRQTKSFRRVEVSLVDRLPASEVDQEDPATAAPPASTDGVAKSNPATQPAAHAKLLGRWTVVYNDVLAGQSEDVWDVDAAALTSDWAKANKFGPAQHEVRTSGTHLTFGAAAKDAAGNSAQWNGTFSGNQIKGTLVVVTPQGFPQMVNNRPVILKFVATRQAD